MKHIIIAILLTGCTTVKKDYDFYILVDELSIEGNICLADEDIK